jgi:hypothetical protein
MRRRPMEGKESVRLPAYHSTIEVHQEGKESVVEWMGRFEPKGTSAEDAQKAIQNIYEAGLQNLQKMFGQLGGTT